MSVIKVKGLQENFTIVPNAVINDKLSWAARGMLLYLCSKPDSWEVCITDLVNQTTGCSKRSGRDAVRKIMDELVECGYMRKTQKRSSGKFERNDYEVSFEPFTENPYTANPTQESTELNKVKKDQIPDIFSGKDGVYIKELSKEEFPHCHEMIRVLEWRISRRYGNYYTGRLSLEEWEYCESQIQSCDSFNHVEYISWWSYKHYNSMMKTPSLPNLVCDMNGIPFNQFYDSTFLQEADI